MAAKPPDAFLSYTRFDDQNDGGAISEFRRRLANAVRAVTGETFEIFQDVDGIGLGEHWPGKLDEMLEETRFFMPILTPSFFRSQACRDELEKFLRAEHDRGRNDLVLPIYYISCRVLEDPSLRASDPLVSAIHERQREDWRERRWKPVEDPEVRRSLEALAYKIDDARRRAGEEARERAEAERRARQEEAQRRAEEAARSRAAEEQRRRDEEAEAKRRAEEERRKVAPKGLEPGTVFRYVDAPWCPELVIVPPGEFMMGSPGNDPEASRSEKPRHLVRIVYPIAIGRFPVTFEEYDHFVAATAGKQPADSGWGRGRRPVINVSWDDAKAYIEWITSEADQPFRLLSEAEWEYACRAGTSTRYWWGDEITGENANYAGNIGKTSKAGEYPANPFGLYDMHGNVWEWVEDCWNDNYEGAPKDGSACMSGECARRVLRGGSWGDYPRILRAAGRFGDGAGYRYFTFGLRVARTLTL